MSHVPANEDLMGLLVSTCPNFSEVEAALADLDSWSHFPAWPEGWVVSEDHCRRIQNGEPIDLRIFIRHPDDPDDSFGVVLPVVFPRCGTPAGGNCVCGAVCRVPSSRGEKELRLMGKRVV